MEGHANPRASPGKPRRNMIWRPPRRREGMFGSIVVGTDGSATAQEAVRQATELAKGLNANIYLVSAYEPVPEGRLREERQQVPEDLQWMVNPREDVEGTLRASAESLASDGIEVETHAREGDP